MAWNSLADMQSNKFTCGYCGNIVATVKGYYPSNGVGKIYICPHCEKPSYFDQSNSQTPGVAPGNEIDHLPEKLKALYLEARNCVSVGAYTASVLACRKLLMNIAVEQGADEGKSFLNYVEFMADKGYVPPNGRGWVDHIRKKGNEANHEIALMLQEDANELISFAEMLLKFIYEFPNKIPSS